MNQLQQLQEDIVALLLANPATAVVPFTSFRRQVVEAVADEAQAAWKIRVAGKVGVACQVLMPALRVVTPEVPGPQFECEIIIRTFHDPKINNSGLTAEDVAMANLSWLDGQMIDSPPVELHGDTRGEALAPNLNYPGFLVYDCKMACALPQSYLGRTAQPTISIDDNLITLSCTDGAAKIWFTIDGTMPLPPVEGPGGPAGSLGGATNTSVLYTAPFPIVAPVQCFRAVAWNPVFMPSIILNSTVE